MIDSDGTIYEGLGWRQKCIDEDFDGICFAFIGTFHKNSPKNDTIVKLKTMIDCGARKNLLESNFTMYIHRRLMSQGNNKLYDVIPNDQNFKQHFKMHNSNRRRWRWTLKHCILNNITIVLWFYLSINYSNGSKLVFWIKVRQSKISSFLL